MPEYALDRVTPKVARLTLKFVRRLPEHWITRELARQLLRSGSGVASNYRAAKRAQSAADLITKLKKVEEESDESAFWTELLQEDGLPADLAPLTRELRELCNEVTALAVAAVRTTRSRMPKKAPRKPRL